MPDTTRCGCGGYGGHSRLGRRHSGDVKRLSTARHPEGLRRHSPTPHGAAVVAVPSSDRHHDGGKKSKVFGGSWECFAGCWRQPWWLCGDDGGNKVRRRWCEGGDGASMMMKVMVSMGLWLRGWH
ncbi:hypothetical protein Tco_0848730 [Tanacetum coccineum]